MAAGTAFKHIKLHQQSCSHFPLLRTHTRTLQQIYRFQVCSRCPWKHVSEDIKKGHQNTRNTDLKSVKSSRQCPWPSCLDVPFILHPSEKDSPHCWWDLRRLHSWRVHFHKHCWNIGHATIQSELCPRHLWSVQGLGPRRFQGRGSVFLERASVGSCQPNGKILRGFNGNATALHCVTIRWRVYEFVLVRKQEKNHKTVPQSCDWATADGHHKCDWHGGPVLLDWSSACFEVTFRRRGNEAVEAPIIQSGLAFNIWDFLLVWGAWVV